MAHSLSIGIDSLIVAGMVFAKCDSKTCFLGRPCTECTMTNESLLFPLFMPFSYRIVRSPYLYCTLVPGSYGQRPVSTFYVLAVYAACSLFIGNLFNPEARMGRNDNKWHNAVYEQRLAASEEWAKGKKAFDEEKQRLVVAGNNDDEALVKLMERRIYEAFAILESVTGKYSGAWEDRHREMVDLYGTRRLVPVTEGMAGCDRFEQLVEETAEWNAQHSTFRDMLKTEMQETRDRECHGDGYTKVMEELLLSHKK
jgi:hypothetical protein